MELMPWPPVLAELKTDLKIDDERDDERLQTMLDAACAFVERVHAGRYAFGDLASTRPEVPADMRAGTLRLAGRWHKRRDSPNGLVAMGELGSARIPSFDPDIDRMLRVGRYRRAVIA